MKRDDLFTCAVITREWICVAAQLSRRRYISDGRIVVVEKRGSPSFMDCFLGAIIPETSHPTGVEGIGVAAIVSHGVEPATLSYIPALGSNSFVSE